MEVSLYPALTGSKGWRKAGKKTVRKSPIDSTNLLEKNTPKGSFTLF